MSKIDVPFHNWRDRIEVVCFDCGRAYGVVTSEECIAITCYTGNCDVCLETKTVTSPRNFGRLKLLSYREWIAKCKMAKVLDFRTTTGKLATVGIGGKR